MYLYHHPARHNLPNSYVIIFWGIFLLLGELLLQASCHLMLVDKA